MKRLPVPLAVFAALGIVAGCGARLQRDNPLGPNAGCYVCHMTFVGETISKVHAAAKIACTRCHGTSAAHANDENVGATPPDVVYGRGEVNSHCRACHKTHDVAPELIVARLAERRKENPPPAPLTPPVVCTDCHGEHKIARAGE